MKDLTEKYKDSLKKILFSPELPEHNSFVSLTETVSNILDHEIKYYRPLNSEYRPGSLLDFTDSTLPVVVVPDLHARPDFLWNILNYELPKSFFQKARKRVSILQALKNKSIILVCVGDALHTERGTQERWAKALVEYTEGIHTGPAMSAEMLDGLNLLCGIFKLKEFFPENFHFLKGNHENITNRTAFGDYAFRKFADEGNMVKHFISEYYGEEVLYLISCVEDSFPLLFVNQNLVVSHAEPRQAYTKEEIINARINIYTVEGLTWTPNDDADEGSVKAIIENVGIKNNFDNYIYLAGHRPVYENYAERQEGLFIQIHNPTKQNIALVYPNKKFNPQTDIVSVK